MQQKPEQSFFKIHVLPALLVFLVPVFSIWFFKHAEDVTDREILSQLESSIAHDGRLSATERARALEFYRTVPASKIMASAKPEAVEMQAMFASVSSQYWTFRWMKRVAWICLAGIGATLLVVGLSVALALRSQPAQYYALRFGVPILKLSAAVQVLGQAWLAVVLSYWVTAIFLEIFSIKLIVVVAVGALMAAVTLWSAIFARAAAAKFEVHGEVLSETDAAPLWTRVRELAARLNTAPPDQIIVGISPIFFVTEHPVACRGVPHQGRTLFLSLPMLKILSRGEADAVLGHELAHFSGNDTLWARKIAPLIQKFTAYLNTLARGYALIVAHFMHLFWKLYGLSMQRLSREREFRADKLGGDLSSNEEIVRALVKTTCYCEYRNRTQTSHAHHRSLDHVPNVAERLEQGYPAFLSAFTATDKSIEEQVPHPFDTHPTLKNRVARLGFDARETLRDPAIQLAVQGSWYGAIDSVSVLEERLWPTRLELPSESPEQAAIWKLLPVTPEQTAKVVQIFPRTAFRNDRNVEAVVEFDRISVTGWAGPIFYRDILEAVVGDSQHGPRIVITHASNDHAAGVRVTAVHVRSFRGEKGELLQTFQLYYSRFRNAAAVARGIAP